MAQGAIITLTGFMGTGKSIVGRALAERLGYTFADTDAMIEAEHGPIPEIFATHGEDAFREIERAVIGRAMQREGSVIATGGGAVLDPSTAQALKQAGLVYTLTASADEIVRRVTADVTSGRPLLAGPDPAGRVTELLDERAPVYAQFPQVRTDGRQPEAIANEIAMDAANRGALTLGAPLRPTDSMHAPPTSTRSAGRLFAVTVFALVVLGAGAFAIRSFVLSDDDAEARIADLAAPSFTAPEGAPEADIYFDAVGGGEIDRATVDRLQGMFGFDGPFDEGGMTLNPDSLVALATVGTDAGNVTLVQFDMIQRFPGQPAEEVRCVTELASGMEEGGGMTCTGSFDNAQTTTGWGGLQNGGRWMQTISVIGAPDGARWMRLELADGWSAVTPVVNGAGLVTFDQFDAQPRRITVFDDALNEVWGEPLF